MIDLEITDIIKNGGFVSVAKEENGFTGFVLGNIASDGNNSIMMFEDWQVQQEYSGRRDVRGFAPRKINDEAWRLGSYFLYHITTDLDKRLHSDANSYERMIKSRRRKDFDFDDAQAWLNDRLLELSDG
jgi:hypothetical protein